METALLISIMINVLLAMILYYYADSIKNVKIDKEEKIIEIQRKAQQDIEKTQQEAKKEISEIAKENSKLDKARLLAEQSENRMKQDMLEAQQKMQTVLTKLLEKYKFCVESNYRTLQALQAKFEKAINLQTERKTLSEKNIKKLIHRFEKLKKEIINDLQENEITQQVVEQAFEKIKQQIEKTK
jgi:hypothetical protein